jgi:hypothetical protein
MTYFGVDSNTNVLLHSLIAKVTRMELVLELFQTNSKEGEDDPTLPKNFKELRELVVHLAQNDVERTKESKTWTDIIVEQSKNINDLKAKIDIINAKNT